MMSRFFWCGFFLFTSIAHGQKRGTIVSGLSGTAQTGPRLPNGMLQRNGWCTAFFPAEAPKYAVTIILENIESANKDVGPVVAGLVKKLMDPK